jgi:hypothetical protein
MVGWFIPSDFVERDGYSLGMYGVARSLSIE